MAVSNGTATLHLCALALDVQPGQRVITTPITFAASANCVLYCGEVHFADTEWLTAEQIREEIRLHVDADFEA